MIHSINLSSNGEKGKAGGLGEQTDHHQIGDDELKLKDGPSCDFIRAVGGFEVLVYGHT
jgi:hypothetical protein